MTTHQAQNIPRGPRRGRPEKLTTCDKHALRHGSGEQFAEDNMGYTHLQVNFEGLAGMAALHRTNHAMTMSRPAWR